MDDKQLRLEAIRLAHDVVLRKSDYPPREMADMAATVARISDFIVSYVNDEHDVILEAIRLKREEAEERLRKLREEQPITLPNKHPWWKKGK